MARRSYQSGSKFGGSSSSSTSTSTSSSSTPTTSGSPGDTATGDARKFRYHAPASGSDLSKTIEASRAKEISVQSHQTGMTTGTAESKVSLGGYTPTDPTSTSKVMTTSQRFVASSVMRGTPTPTDIAVEGFRAPREQFRKPAGQRGAGLIKWSYDPADVQSGRLYKKVQKVEYDVPR